MKKHYDIIVVGGGPGGSWAAKSAAEQGVSVLLLEKDKEIGIPVRCGEGILISFLSKLIHIKKEWVAQEITKALRQKGKFNTLKDDATNKVLQGVTTLEEAASAVMA